MSQAANVHNAIASLVALYGQTLAEQAREAEAAVKSRDTQIASQSVVIDSLKVDLKGVVADLAKAKAQIEDARAELLDREEVIANQAQSITEVTARAENLNLTMLRQSRDLDALREAWTQRGNEAQELRAALAAATGAPG